MVQVWIIIRKNNITCNNGYNIFFVVTPTALIMRIIGKDLLNLKFTKNKSYWIEKSGPKSKMKNQF